MTASFSLNVPKCKNKLMCTASHPHSNDIIDAFTEIRGEKEKRAEDTREKCFICSIARVTFEQHGTSFQSHCQAEHDPWSYLLYCYSIRKKNALDYNGVESHIADSLDTDNVSFMPLGKALALQEKSVQDHVSVGLGNTTELYARVSGVEAQVSAIRSSLEELNAFVRENAQVMMRRASTDTTCSENVPSLRRESSTVSTIDEGSATGGRAQGAAPPQGSGGAAGLHSRWARSSLDGGAMASLNRSNTSPNLLVGADTPLIPPAQHVLSRVAESGRVASLAEGGGHLAPTSGTSTTVRSTDASAGWFRDHFSPPNDDVVPETTSKLATPPSQTSMPMPAPTCTPNRALLDGLLQRRPQRTSPRRSGVPIRIQAHLFVEEIWDDTGDDDDDEDDEDNEDDENEDRLVGEPAKEQEQSHPEVVEEGAHKLRFHSSFKTSSSIREIIAAVAACPTPAEIPHAEPIPTPAPSAQSQQQLTTTAQSGPRTGPLQKVARSQRVLESARSKSAPNVRQVHRDGLTPRYIALPVTPNSPHEVQSKAVSTSHSASSTPKSPHEVQSKAVTTSHSASSTPKSPHEVPSKAVATSHSASSIVGAPAAPTALVSNGSAIRARAQKRGKGEPKKQPRTPRT